MNRYSTVLLIDDDPVSLFLGERLLQDLDIADKVFTFARSREALDFLKEFKKSSSLNKLLLLLDINMPEYDGFEFLETLIDEGVDINEACILMLTNSIDTRDKLKAESFNVAGYLAKPLSGEVLKEYLCTV